MYSEYFLWITQVNTDRRVAREFVTFFEKRFFRDGSGRIQNLDLWPKHRNTQAVWCLWRCSRCLDVPLAGCFVCLWSGWWESTQGLGARGSRPRCARCGDGGGELSQSVWFVWFGWNESNKVPFKPNFLHNELTCFGSTDFHALKPRTCTERLRSRVAKKASILVSKFQLCFLVFSRLTCCLITVYFCRSLEQSGAKQMGLNTGLSLLRKSQVSGIQDSYLWGGDSPGLGMRSWRASCQSVACPLKFGAPGYPVWKRST